MIPQTRIPCVLMRGGTSKGAYFLASDLPANPKLRDRVLLRIMGAPDARQIDGLGGADPLTTKVAIVSPASRADADIDYLFAQVMVDEPVVDVSPNCGNMLAGVGPFAIEAGLITASDPETRLRIHMVNSANVCEVVLQTPGGKVTYDGDARIDGVPGTAAPVMANFLDTAGSTCGVLLPTGNVIDRIDGIPCTLIDNGMPVVVMSAAAFDRTGYETREAMNADDALKARLESIRLQAGPMMNLNDVTEKAVPKMCLIAPPRDGGAIATRCFIPNVCHATIGVLAAVTIATACILPGSAADGIAVVPGSERKLLSVEHPTGEVTVSLEVEGSAEAPDVRRAGLLRTTRRLMEGHALIPADVWNGTPDAP